MNSNDENLVTEYEVDPSTKAVLNYFKSLNEGCTEVCATEIVNKTRFPRQAIIEVFKRLQLWEYGYFTIGRKGNDSRFESRFDLRKIAEVVMPPLGRGAATEDSVDLSGSNRVLEPAVGQKSAVERKPTVTHHFLLRPDLSVSFELPVDFTISEAGRISNFLRSLPFENI